MDYPGSRKIRIILADPDAAFCVFARYSLEQLGFHVTVANDGADLVARFLPKEFDVVLVGMAAPLFDGLKVLRAIKQRNQATPVILVCNSDCTDLAEQGIHEGAFVYFKKPLNDFAQLGDAVTRAVETQIRQHPDVESSVTPNAAAGTKSDLMTTGVFRHLVDNTLSQPLNVILQMLAAAGAQVAQAPYGVVLLTDSGKELQVSGVHGFANQDTATLDLAARVGDAFAARVIAERRAIVTSTLAQSKEVASQQAIGVPLLSENRVLGALVAYPFAPGAVNAARVVQLELVAAQGVLALEFARLREENARLIGTDPITGVLKRELFLELADREFRRSWRYNQPITAIMVDVDDLATINLRCGHTFGNHVLREVAAVCANTVRSVDLIGRYDADAFALLLLMTESEKVKTVAERLRLGINTLRLPNAPSPVQITAALGVCSYPRESCASIFDLLALAQEAQQAARYRGTNQVAYT